MKHADSIIEKILFLKGVPQMTEYGNLKIGSDVETILINDLNLEIDAIKDLKNAIKYCAEIEEIGAKDLLEKILISEEEHYDFLETQIGLIKKVGLQNYLATQI